MSNFYSVIPTNVIFSSKLKPNEKILYGVLVSLSNEQGNIFLTNQEIADLYTGHGHDCNPRTISGWVNSIIDIGLFSKEMKDNNVRVLKIATNPLLPIEQPNIGRTQGNKHTQEINDVMDYYEEVLTKRPKLSQTIITNMRNHFKNGHTVLDFKKVIAIKKVDPYFVENPQYQLPSTLFRPKNFVKYINQYDMQVGEGTSTQNEERKSTPLSNEEF